MKEFEEIYRLHYSYVYKFLYRTCQHDHHLAEELTQETFYQAFRSMHRYNGKCSIGTWLCSIAKNIWFHHIRKHKDICLDLESLEETLYDDYEKTPEAYAERRERSAAIRNAIAHLKPKYREVVLLRASGELTFAQIADIMKITESSAKVLYFRAKNDIKESLENEGYF
ncbi:MAG: RNA polymerase sigma factor [Clostridia bacterium]|nr:RNA polymerase sigma factor [Clostridia bacterium]